MIQQLIAAALILGQASPAPPPCISRQQIADATVAILPILIDGARERCGPGLAATAFLAQPASSEFGDRLRGELEQRQPSAAEGLRKFGEDLAGLSDSTVVALMGEGMTEMFLGPMDAGGCSSLDALLESISPLTPTAVGQLSGAFFSLSGPNFGDTGPAICPS